MQHVENYEEKFVEKKMEELPPLWREALQKHFIAKNIINAGTKAKFVNVALSFYEATRIEDPKKVTREDVEKWVEKISREVSEWTLATYQINFRSLMKTVYGTKDYPPCVEWLKPVSTKRLLKKNNMRDKILTEEEVKRLVDATDNLKHKALIMVTWEGALRAGEALSLRIRDIEFTERGVRIRVQGKTGERTLLLFKAEPYLREWLQIHPFRDDPNAYIFYIRFGGDVKQMSHHGFNAFLYRLAKKAGIKKKIHSHILRHSRLTQLATILTEQELKQYAGWEKDSRMAAVYVHLSGRDTEKISMKAAGLKVEEKKEEKKVLIPKKCPRCQTLNRPDALYCSTCGLILDERVAIRIRKEEEEETKFFEKLVAALIKLTKEKPELKEELKKLLQ